MVQVHELGVVSRMENVRAYLPLPEHLKVWLPDWPLELVNERLDQSHHGDFDSWAKAIHQLPNSSSCEWRASSAIEIDIDAPPAQITELLMALHPWRKGPYKIGALKIDTEWRSDWKWQRLAPHIALDQHNVLDIGSGNGYFGWQMLNAGAQSVIGIDPTILFCMQHLAIQHFINHPNHWVLPLGIEDIPLTRQFDTVLSMGVIYHRRDPIEHVQTMSALTKSGGQAVLESLVVQANKGFKPNGRYARMRNVWWIPSARELAAWMKDAGFTEVQIIDVSPTTLEEQRSTPWMTFESLAESLDPNNPDQTIEGYPAPIRAMVKGTKR